MFYRILQSFEFHVWNSATRQHASDLEVHNVIATHQRGSNLRSSTHTDSAKRMRAH